MPDRCKNHCLTRPAEPRRPAGNQSSTLTGSVHLWPVLIWTPVPRPSLPPSLLTHSLSVRHTIGRLSHYGTITLGGEALENRTEEAVLTRAPLQKETIHFNANGIEPLTFRGTKTKTEREGRRSIEREVFSYLPAKNKKIGLHIVLSTDRNTPFTDIWLSPFIFCLHCIV